MLFIITLAFLAFSALSSRVSAYSDMTEVPLGSLTFCSGFSPAGSDPSQILGFEQSDPSRSNSAVLLQDGAEVYAYASVPAGMGGRPNVNSSAWFVTRITEPYAFSYAVWSINGGSTTLPDYHNPDTLGHASYGFCLSGSVMAGSDSVVIYGPSIWAAADYWYNNNQFVSDYAEVGLQLHFQSLGVQIHRTEVIVGCTAGSGVAPLTVAFDATVSDGIPPYSLSWDFGGLGESSLPNPTFTFQSPGTYSVSCTATDALGIHDTKNLSITVLAPPASTQTCTLSINAEGGGTTTPPPGSYQEAMGSMIMVTSEPLAGYALGMWLLDGTYYGSASDAALDMQADHVLTAFFVPALEVSGAAAPLDGPSPMAVNFSCIAWGGIPPYSLQWDFGDMAQSNAQNTTHIYALPGTFLANVTITDYLGRSASSTVGPLYAFGSGQPADFVVSKNGDVYIPQGGSSSALIGVYSDSWRSEVQLSLEWLGSAPPDATASLVPPQGIPDFTSVLSFTAGQGTPLGAYQCIVKGESDGVSHSVDVNVNVVAAGTSNVTVSPCNIDNGLCLDRVIVGEFVGIDVTGRLPADPSETINITSWLDGSWLWSPESWKVNTSGTLELSQNATTDPSGWFTLRLGSLLGGCWVGSNASSGSVFEAHALIKDGSGVVLYNGSWSLWTVTTKVDFDYDPAGVNTTFHLLYADGEGVDDRAGRFSFCFQEADLGSSTPCDDLGISQLRIPYSALEDLPYTEANWTVLSYTNSSGECSLLTWYEPSQVRFTEVGAQFLMRNATHMAVQSFDWGSPYHPLVPSTMAYLWWNGMGTWNGSSGIIPGCPFGPSGSAKVISTDTGYCLTDPSGATWAVGDTVDLGASAITAGGTMGSVIFITLPQPSALADSNPGIFMLRLVPPHSQQVLYSPARTGTVLLYGSIFSAP